MTINCILLVDDDEATNFIHKRIIQKSGIDVSIQTVENGKEAIDFLTSSGNFEGKEYPKPGLIFLDINMPVMNGWEFLEVYEKLPEEQKAKILVAMLTTSLNPDDKSKADSNQYINGFVNKPLSKEVILEYMKELEKHL